MASVGVSMSSGPLHINSGALKQQKIGLERAALEGVLNAVCIDADKQLSLVRITTDAFSPMSHDGRESDKKCICYISNTEFQAQRMASALNFGATKGTAVGHDKQTTENCFGIGFKEAAISFGGTPGWGSFMPTATKGVYSYACTLVSKEVTRHYQHIHPESEGIVCKVSFQALVNLGDDDSVVDVNIVSPTSNDTEDKLLLYFSGLDFCLPNTRFDEVPNMKHIDKLLSKNIERLEQCVASTVSYVMREYQKPEIERCIGNDALALFADPRYRRTCDVDDKELLTRRREAILAQLSAFTIAFMYDIDPRKLKRAEPRAVMGKPVPDAIHGHRLVLDGSSTSLSTAIACKFNRHYFRQKGRDISILLDGRDVFADNPYTPIERVQKAVLVERQRSLHELCEVPLESASACGNAVVHLGSMSLASCDIDRCAKQRVADESGTPRGPRALLMAREADCIPSVERGEGGDYTVSWPGYELAAERPPPPGVLLLSEGVVYNALSPSVVYTNPNELFKNASTKNLQGYDLSFEPESGFRKGGGIKTSDVALSVLRLLGCAKGASGKEVEARLGDVVFGEHPAYAASKDKMLISDWQVCVMDHMAISVAEAKKRGLDGYPEHRDLTQFLFNIFGMNCSCILDLNLRHFDQDIEKTQVWPAMRKGCISTNAFLRCMRRAMMCFCMNHCLSARQKQTLVFVRARIKDRSIDADADSYFPRAPKEPVGALEGPSTFVLALRSQAPQSPPFSVAPGPAGAIVLRPPPQNWDNASFDEWADIVHRHKPSCDTDARRLYKDSTKDGWFVEWRPKNMAGTNEWTVYFVHKTHEAQKLFPLTAFPTKKAAKAIDVWMLNGGLSNMAAFPKELVHKVTPKATREQFRIALGMPPPAPKRSAASSVSSSPAAVAFAADVVDIDSAPSPAPLHEPRTSNSLLKQAFGKKFPSGEAPELPFLFRAATGRAQIQLAADVLYELHKPRPRELALDTTLAVAALGICMSPNKEYRRYADAASRPMPTCSSDDATTAEATHTSLDAAETGLSPLAAQERGEEAVQRAVEPTSVLCKRTAGEAFSR